MKLIKKIRILLTGINALLCVIILLMDSLYIQGLDFIDISTTASIFLTIFIIACPIIGLILSVLAEVEEMNDNGSK